MGAQKIIVISSHVAAGAVGARAAGFGLERLGFEAVLVPTVILPWHPGQGRGTRIEPPAEAFAALLADLAGAPWLASVAGMLTGYFGNAGQVTAAARLTRAVRAANPSALVVCDPVSGDGGALFVAEAIAAAIRDDLAPLADALTPNRFELGWLTRSGATDNAGLGEAARQLGARETVVTSAFAPPGEAGALIVAGGESHLATHRAVLARRTARAIFSLRSTWRIVSVAGRRSRRRGRGLRRCRGSRRWRRNPAPMPCRSRPASSSSRRRRGASR